MATVGKGKYTYELVPGWEKLPEGWVLGRPLSSPTPRTESISLTVASTR